MKAKALNPGTVLTGMYSYRIERVLGSGGFGITYLASYIIDNGNYSYKVYVAIKEHFMQAQCERAEDGNTVICPGTEESRAMTANSMRDFISEARRLSQYGAGHPNIVRVSEIIEANDTAYYVMEYLEGQSLADYIAQYGPLSEQDIEHIIYPIIDTVAYLHRQRVTHLDIKPGNIMLSQNTDGTIRPVLIDFGLSKHYNADGSATSTVNTMACSEGYAPMEQYAGISTFFPAADVYALGATLYDAATGKRPAKSSDWPSGEPRATISTLPLSENLKRIILKALSPMASDRFPDAGAMLVRPPEFKGYPSFSTVKLQRKGPVVSGSSKKKFGRLGIILISTAVVILIGFGIFKLSKSTVQRIKAAWDENVTAGNSENNFVGGSIEASDIETIGSSNNHNAEDTPQGTTSDAERIAAERAEAERIQQETSARQSTEVINGYTVNWAPEVTTSQKDVLRRLINNMQYVSGGTFNMGASNLDRAAGSAERPTHQVTLSSYRIGSYEVTQKEWETVMGRNPSRFRGNDLPVEYISWNDCQDFISHLNQMTGLHFHLPTEAQWEFAARGGNFSNGYIYSGTNEAGGKSWNQDNSRNRTHPVGQKLPNELGLYDMSGNVAEWCSDWYGEYNSDSQTNPSGPSSGSYRLYRGGSWCYDISSTRVSYRSCYNPVNKYNYLGMRLAL